MTKSPVIVRRTFISLPTYLPEPASRHPMFLEKRVYQGSSGKIYPLPFIDRIAEVKCDVEWDAIYLENEFLEAMILPQIGGRIHSLRDKTNGYDVIYNQAVIKPALVGLAGPWISGGIEFNWPQHHRPATFMPVDVEIENHADGAVTVWLGDHEPMARMKGMHGACLHPGRAFLELKVRAYNRTPLVQTFLWWANVATRVHEGYQSFFPPDVYYVADHARRSMSEYPLCQGHYYGVNYGERSRSGVPPAESPAQFIPPASGGGRSLDYPPNDLSWYANIPVPTSYMCMGSKEDFFGGYDYFANAGIVHIADHRIAPGKKQWTWGNHEFGYAWDRNLTDPDERGEFAPYVELMAGVFTDNQPDFSFLQPGETKTWSQYWYPIQMIGAAQHANLDAAASLHLSGNKIRIGISVTSRFANAEIILESGSRQVFRRTYDLAPGNPFLEEVALVRSGLKGELTLRVRDSAGHEIISYTPRKRARGDVPPPATEPPEPGEIVSNDELFITGLHLEQYRHATRSPAPYWREALRRDPLDARCNNALGLWHLRRGEFPIAVEHFRAAIKRLTRRNPNPYDGEPYYNIGLALRYLGSDEEAYDAFYKAAWNQQWQAPACHSIAEIDCRRGEWARALDHIERSLARASDNLHARNLKVLILRELNRLKEADALLRDTRALDPLDWWSRLLGGESLTCDTQTLLDIALDFARAGFFQAATKLLGNPKMKPDPGTAPLVGYYLGWLAEQLGDARRGLKYYKQAAGESRDYCFPARLEEITILTAAMRANPQDSRAPYYLGNLYYDKRRHQEAMGMWERAVKLQPRDAVAWRNLGIGYFNVTRQPAKARAAYDRAFRVDSKDAQLLYERDQLWKRLGENPARRLRELERHLNLVNQRDDLSVELCALYNQTGRHNKALAIITKRNFQPWEGGEGQALGQHVRTHLALGRQALDSCDAPAAQMHFETALKSPGNLGEAKHLLANQSDIHYWLGVALDRSGDKKAARAHWLKAATFKGDFQEMKVRAFSEMTYYSALALERLGRTASARKLLRDLLSHAKELAATPAKIDYFATSLPTMLIFEDDLDYRQQTTALFLEAQAQLGLGNRSKAGTLLKKVLSRDPNHALAADMSAELAR
jgi:tetratricopeptide (TPR) repeat protein